MRKQLKQFFLLLTAFILCLPADGLYATSSSPFELDPYDINSYKRTIKFAGYNFKVKDSSISETGRLGPNQNIFSDTRENVRVDAQGRLILNLTQKNGLWQAAEVISVDDFGYGIYTFKIASRIDRIDPHVTFSAFLYQDDNNEIDLEFSDFGNHNSQFVVQPYDLEDHMKPFFAKLNGSYTSYTINYKPEGITFSAYHGHNTDNLSHLIQEWTYSNKPIPSPNGMKLRFNLYIRHLDHPLNNQPQQIIISDFNYIKL